MFIDDYACDRCGFQAQARSVIGYYVIDQRLIPAPTMNAWCNYCRTITLVERLPPIEWLDSEISRLQNHRISEVDIEWAKSWEQPLDQSIASRIATYSTLAVVAGARRTSNNCIECGLADFTPIADDDNNLPDQFAHPECGGLLRRVAQSHGSQDKAFLLDVNGSRIAQ